MATFPLARNLPFRNVARPVQQIGPRSGEREEDLLNTRKMRAGRAAYRGYATEHCAPRTARQIRAVESVKEASSFTDAKASALLRPIYKKSLTYPL